MTTETSTRRRGGSAVAILRGRSNLWLLALLVPALIIPFNLSPYLVREVTMVLVFACAIMGVNFLTGYLGNISLGHGAFLAVGAYVVAILDRDTGLPLIVSVVIAIAITFLLGLIVGIPALRVQGVYLALITLAVAVATPPLIRKFPDLTGGSQGITVSIDMPEWIPLAEDQIQYLAVLLCVVLAWLCIGLLTRGRSGRTLAAIKDNELIARSMGINLVVVKSLVFAGSAALCGLGGALYAAIVGFVSPESFGLLLSINLLAAMVIGGGGTLAGPLIGAIFLQFMPMIGGSINQSFGGLAYGVALIAIMLLAPGGIAGLLGSIVRRIPVPTFRREPS